MDLNTIKELHSRHLSHSTAKFNVLLASGKDNTVYDLSGRGYLDLTGGNGENVLGYSHPALLSAVAEQAGKLFCASDSFYNELSAVFAHELTEGTVFDRVSFFTDGASALGGMLKIIKDYFDKKSYKKKILIVADSLHAISFGAALSGQFVGENDLLRFTPLNDFESFKANLTDDIGAVLIETFQPENGLSITKHDFLLNAYAHCKIKDVLLVMNEFISGLGRSGHVFSYDYSGIKPDIVLLSKGLGGGMPISAILSRGEVAYSMTKEKSTLLSCYLPSLAAGRVVIRELKCGLSERVVDIGNYFKAKLFKLARFEFVREIRGTGLILGVELDQRIDAHDIIFKLAKEGILASISSKNTLILLPPYTITRKEIDIALQVMESVFSEIL